jgi:hypothetical protein
VNRRPPLRSIAIFAAVLAPLAPPAPAAPADPVAYVSRVDDGNRMAVTLTNYGVIGNSFISRSPSMEYPLGTGYEHLTQGGLWIGAQSVDQAGAFTGVTSAMLDAPTGATTPLWTEFTPEGNAIVLRSRLNVSPYFDPAAVSDLDLVSSFNDVPVKQALGNPEIHRPLQVLVRQEAYTWGDPDFDDIVFLHFVVKAMGPTLTNVWVGLYTELASGPKNAYSTWPPTSSSSPLGSWFSKKLLAWDGPIQLVREHRCASLPVPAGCAFAVTPAWAGVQLLTPASPAVPQHVTLAAWNWNPAAAWKDQDVERYAIMSAGTIHPLTGDSLQPQTGDPAELLALGPFPSLAPGDSVVVDFALVGGGEEADIQANARSALALYGAGIPTPVTVSLADLEASADRVSLTWTLGSLARGQRVDVERSDTRNSWRVIGGGVADATGRLRFEDRAVRPGATYGYRVVLPAAGGEPRSAAGEVWVEVPFALAFGLEAPASNPSVDGRVRLSFTLPDGAAARLETFDTAGRRVISREVGALGAGRHSIALGEGAPLPAGIYQIRLLRAGRVAQARAVVIR